MYYSVPLGGSNKYKKKPTTQIKFLLKLGKGIHKDIFLDLQSVIGMAWSFGSITENNATIEK